MTPHELVTELWKGLEVCALVNPAHNYLCEHYEIPKTIHVPCRAISDAIDAGLIRWSRRTGMISITDAGLAAIGKPTNQQMKTVATSLFEGAL